MPCDVLVWWFEGHQIVLQLRCLDAWDSEDSDKNLQKAS